MAYQLDPIRTKRYRQALVPCIREFGWCGVPAWINQYPLHYHMPCKLWGGVKWVIDLVRVDCRYCHAIRLFLIGFAIGTYF